jgi:hypothetical protein
MPFRHNKKNKKENYEFIFSKIKELNENGKSR